MKASIKAATAEGDPMTRGLNLIIGVTTTLIGDNHLAFGLNALSIVYSWLNYSTKQLP